MNQNMMPETIAPYYDLLSRLKRLFFNRKYPLAVQLETAPFFIIGSGRCGTTLLRRMLQTSPDIHIPPETYVLGEVGRLFMRNRQMDWLHLVNIVLSVLEYQREFHTFKINTRDIAHQLWELPEQERSLASILDAFYRFHGQQTGQTFTTWGDKTPKNTFHLDMIIRTFPQAKFIHLLRDGVDVAQSFVSRGLINDLGKAATHWQSSVLISRKFMQQYPKQCLEIRYEELVAKPEQVLQSLCDFLGISFDSKMVNSRDHTGTMGDLTTYEHYNKVLAPVSVKHIGLGRSKLDQTDMLTLKNHIGGTLSHMGYPL